MDQMERGFIQTDMQIRFLLLYILNRLDGPADTDTIADIALCDEGVRYFDFASALDKITETGHAVYENGKYSITRKGRVNGEVTEDQLPYSVLMRCDDRIMEVNERLRYERRIHTEKEKTENGWRIRMSFDSEDEKESIVRVELLVAEEIKADRLLRKFMTDPQKFADSISDFAK